MDTSSSIFPSFNENASVTAMHGPNRIGHAIVYFTPSGGYIGHNAYYPSHIECVNVPKPGACDGTLCVQLQINSWERIELIKEAYSLVMGCTKVNEVYSGLPRDWSSTQQMLQSHPVCARFDLRQYSGHPEHSKINNGKEQQFVKVKHSDKETLCYIKQLMNQRYSSGTHMLGSERKNRKHDDVPKGSPPLKRIKLHLTAGIK